MSVIAFPISLRTRRKYIMLMKPIRLVAALASLTLATLPAHAASGSASASITNFSYQLIDLDLTDNITPSITWSYYPSWIFVTAEPNYQHRESGELGTLELVNAVGGVNGTTAQDGVSTRAYFTSTLDSSSLYFDGWVSHGKDFTLSPSTGLLISATASLSLAREADNHGHASVWMAGGFDTIGTTQDFDAQAFQQRYITYQSGERDYLLSAYLRTGKEARDGTIVLSAESYAQAYPTPVAMPVPEPATYGMLLAGALVVGAAARRRRGA